ncbi:MAG TPA: V-type ATP synthase subunit A [Nitrospiria bacterium]|nr:V-type ATP synthase subunit A [Nitrospiria bacterium]
MDKKRERPASNREPLRGVISQVSGPTVVAAGMIGTRMYNRVIVGETGLLGEVIRLEGDRATIQVYEDTTGLSLGEAVIDAGEPLLAELGPGLLGSIFDGVQRPLDVIRQEEGNFIGRGVVVPALPRAKQWPFVPTVKSGESVSGGDVIGTIAETPRIEHRVLVPPAVSGKVTEIHEGSFRVTDTIAALDNGTPLTLMQNWPVRTPRPFRERLSPTLPFITGQRIFDLLFPVAAGGTAIVPGGFGTGKTVVEQTLAKHAQADIIIYVGCGERGNEMTEVLADFPELTDPVSGRPLMERTVLVINTSNMPVAAREASIYTGITIAEYYRDMGYRVALMADSTSRWAEALREISSRLEEMPGEEGYPTYLATRLANFYERGGRAACLGSGERQGSITVVSAISPPGGDFSEPVTQCSMRVAGTLWALDSDLAHRRHFPAIDWKRSYSLYMDSLEDYYRRSVAPDWSGLRKRMMALLQQEEELQEIVQLVGIDALQEPQRITLELGRVLREDFLRQHAFSETDASCPMEKQYWMLKVIFDFELLCQDLQKKGRPVEEIFGLPIREELGRMKEIPATGFVDRAKELMARMDQERKRETG